MQAILKPIEDLLVWSFDNILVPLGDAPNTLAIIIGFVGIGYWLRIQKKLTAKAQAEGTLE